MDDKNKIKKNKILHIVDGKNKTSPPHHYGVVERGGTKIKKHYFIYNIKNYN